MRSSLSQSSGRGNNHEPEKNRKPAEIRREHDGYDAASTNHELIARLGVIDLVRSDAIFSAGLLARVRLTRVRAGHFACGIKVTAPVTLP